LWQPFHSKAGLNNRIQGEEIINCDAENGLIHHNLSHLEDCLKKFSYQARRNISRELESLNWVD
jgi:hypothetical protein